MNEFNKRWDISSEDSYENAFKKFKIRILNIFKDMDDHVTKESITDFCQYYGIREIWQTEPYTDRSWSTNIEDRLNQENNEKEFYRLIEVIFSLNIVSMTGYDRRNTYSKRILLERVTQAIDLSDVNVSITDSNGKIILYPRGEKLLDEELVNSSLSFLNKESAEHFTQALQFYQSKKYIKSAEGVRRSIEEFLRFKLENTKGLDTNITELQKRLKDQGGDAQIRNIIGNIFNYLDKYFNDNSKHNDGDINDSENELLIYQVGLLARYIDKSI